MGKSFKYSKAHKQVHRALLKDAGTVHLPSNKVETPKNAYNRKKMRRKIDLRTIQID